MSFPVSKMMEITRTTCEGHSLGIQVHQRLRFNHGIINISRIIITMIKKGKKCRIIKKILKKKDEEE